MQNSLAVLMKKVQKVFICRSPFFPWVSPMNKICQMGQSKEFISLSRRELSSFCLCFGFLLLSLRLKDLRSLERHHVLVWSLVPQCSSALLRATIWRDLSKTSAEQIDFDVLWLLYTCLLTALGLLWMSQSWILGCVTQTEEFCTALLLWAIWRYRCKRLFHGVGSHSRIVTAFSF